jgi:hypothetical protein
MLFWQASVACGAVWQGEKQAPQCAISCAVSTQASPQQESPALQAWVAEQPGTQSWVGEQRVPGAQSSSTTQPTAPPLPDADADVVAALDEEAPPLPLVAALVVALVVVLAAEPPLPVVVPALVPVLPPAPVELGVVVSTLPQAASSAVREPARTVERTKGKLMEAVSMG